MMNSVLVFSHSITSRLQYIIDFLSQYYGLSWKLTSDEEIFIHSHALLFESSVRQVKVECFKKNGYKVFFKAEGDLGFDLFAAVFFLITRYEEYLPYKKDIYGRYAHENSVAFKENFLDLPLVNLWLEDFKNLLKEKNPAPVSYT